jgi:uncharacterized membrane protein YphA (DoxX/SURF4 family)
MNADTTTTRRPAVNILRFPVRVLRALAALIRMAFAQMRTVTTNLGDRIVGLLADRKMARYGLAVARITLGVMIIGSALGNFSTRDYVFGAGSAWTGQLAYPTSDFITLWPFNLIAGLYSNPTSLTIVMVIHIALAVLLLVGYRTRLVMIPLFLSWVTMHDINLLVHDQSDNLVRIAMIALMFASPSERWSVDAWRRRRNAGKTGGIISSWWNNQPVLPSWTTNIAHNCAVIVLGAQLCMVYAAGGLFKAQGEPWFSGTAVYDPIQTRQFGTWPELSDIVTAWAPAVAVATILTVLVQVGFPMLLMRRGTRIFALIVILGFHIGIGVLMGLPWFSLSMLALDCIFISDRSWTTIARHLRAAWRPKASAGEVQADTEVIAIVEDTEPTSVSDPDIIVEQVRDSELVPS